MPAEERGPAEDAADDEWTRPEGVARLRERYFPARDGVRDAGRPSDHEDRRAVRGCAGAAQQRRIADEDDGPRRGVDLLAFDLMPAILPDSRSHGWLPPLLASKPIADVAQLVEHQLPKLRVASSSLVVRFARAASSWPIARCPPCWPAGGIDAALRRRQTSEAAVSAGSISR